MLGPASVARTTPALMLSDEAMAELRALGWTPPVEALPPVVEALPPVVEALPPVVQALPPVVEALPPVAQALPSVAQVLSPVVEAMPAVVAPPEAVVAAASQAASAGPEPAAIFIAVGFLPVAAWGVTTFVTALGGGPAEKTSTLGNKMANARFPAGAGSTVTPAGTRDAKDIFMGGLENMSKDPTGWFFGDASPLYGSPPPAAPLPVQRESRVASRRSAPYVPPVAAPPSVSQVGSSRKGKATSRKARRAPPPATPEEVAARRGLNTGLSGVVEPVGSFAAPPAAMSPPAPKPGEQGAQGAVRRREGRVSLSSLDGMLDGRRLPPQA